MKRTLIAFIAFSILFFTSCGNGSETTSTEKDTTSTTVNEAVTDQSPSQDTATTITGSGNLMKPMQEMMSQMQSMKMTGDFDVDFANMMIEHHQGALAMAQVELSNGKDEKLKAKAQEIITKQNEEQQKLRDFVSTYKPSGMKHGEGELQKSMSDMNSKMKSMQMSGDVDKDFAMMMMQHHEDGIQMLKMEVKNGMSDELKKMAQKSITDQQKDNNEFKSWLASKQ